MTMLLQVVFSVTYGVLGAILAAKHKVLRAVLFMPIVGVGVYLLFAISVTIIDDFRQLFPYTVQHWGTAFAGEVLLSGVCMVAGWISFDGVRTKHDNYVTLGGVLLLGGALVYWNTFHTDYTNLSPDSPQGHFSKQSSNFSCSAMSLANLSTQLNRPMSEREAAEQMHLRKFGGSVHQLGYALEQQGLGFAETQEQEIDELAFPALLIVDFRDMKDGHAILVLNREGDHYQVVDPLHGHITKRTAEWFAKNWRGKGLQGIRPAT